MKFELTNTAEETRKLFPTDKSNDTNCTSRCKFVRISAIVFGIELCNAAQKVFVSPIIFRLGISIYFLTLSWAISPLIGFFLITLLGSLSDQCQSKLGRRRPFIIALAMSILLGLILIAVVPAQYQPISQNKNVTSVSNKMAPTYIILITIIGLGILDSCLEGCEALSRALLVDSAPPKFHTDGLSVFTVVAGVGGTCGYLIGGIDWEGDVIKPGDIFGTNQFFQESMVFAMVGLIFVITTIITLTSVKEVPLKGDKQSSYLQLEEIDKKLQYQDAFGEIDIIENVEIFDLDTGVQASIELKEKTKPASIISMESEVILKAMSFKETVQSLFKMPRSLCILCITNLFASMALCCYTIFFTHFVGEVIYGGSAKAAYRTPSRRAYESGVLMGSFAMAIYLATACFYSMLLKGLSDIFGIKRIYILSLLFGSIGIFIIGISENIIVCFVFSASMGFLYVSTYTTPFILVANYHSSAVSVEDEYHHTKRGLGTDLTFVNNIIFAGQFLVAITIGFSIELTGTLKTICWSSAISALIAAILATFVH